MSYKLVEGEVRLFYHSTRLVGSRPDGDSAWFKPDNAKLLGNIAGRSARRNKIGFAQLRFEGIDALELHFPGSDHQLEEPTVAARDFLLKRLGFQEVSYAESDDIDTSVNDAIPIAVRASIMTRTIDPFGRPVSFVFPGNAPEKSGSDVFLGVPRLNQSLNAALMKEGHAYPAFYSARDANGQRVGGLPGDLRARLTDLAIVAFNNDKGLWRHDQTTTGATTRKAQDLFQLAIF
jgi:endonuclease YncB( thermonuclease family)